MMNFTKLQIKISIENSNDIFIFQQMNHEEHIPDVYNIDPN